VLVDDVFDVYFDVVVCVVVDDFGDCFGCWFGIGICVGYLFWGWFECLVVFCLYGVGVFVCVLVD